MTKSTVDVLLHAFHMLVHGPPNDRFWRSAAGASNREEVAVGKTAAVVVTTAARA